MQTSPEQQYREELSKHASTLRQLEQKRKNLGWLRLGVFAHIGVFFDAVNARGAGVDEPFDSLINGALKQAGEGVVRVREGLVLFAARISDSPP